MPVCFIVRHRRENKKKCSLRGLETHPDVRFFSYPRSSLPDIGEAILLDVEGEVLSAEDQGPFVLLDATWRYAAVMKKQLPQLHACVRRRLPDVWQTAYPRRQLDCPDPTRGLASVEALYAALYITGLSVEGILDHYYWREQFLDLNYCHAVERF